MDVPLHVQVVLFPIAFLLASFAFDLVGAIRDDRTWSTFGGILLFLGIALSVGALLSGQAAGEALKPMTNELRNAVEEHEGLASPVFFFFLGVGLLRFWLHLKGAFNSWRQWLYLLFAGFGVFLMLRTARLGGRLVYIYGAGVNPERVIIPEDER